MHTFPPQQKPCFSLHQLATDVFDGFSLTHTSNLVDTAPLELCSNLGHLDRSLVRTGDADKESLDALRLALRAEHGVAEQIRDESAKESNRRQQGERLEQKLAWRVQRRVDAGTLEEIGHNHERVARGGQDVGACSVQSARSQASRSVRNAPWNACAVIPKASYT